MTRLAEERFRSTETISLQEIDRERTESKKLQKALDGERAAGAAASQRHQSEVRTLRAELGDVRQRDAIADAASMRAEAARVQDLLRQAVVDKTQRAVSSAVGRVRQPKQATV